MQGIHITFLLAIGCATASGWTSEKAEEAPIVATTEDLELAKEVDFGPTAEKELGVARKEVFEFTREPSITKVDGDRINVSFAVKAFCDATVAVEDANGHMIRHVASGVLGANAPAPFKKNALEQSIVWDGKNDAGRYIDDKSGLSIRVSLGLKGTYEKSLHESPYALLGDYPALSIGADGVYLFEDNMCDYLRVYDHDAKYKGMLVPFKADRLDKIKGLSWYKPPAGEKMPFKAGNLNNTLLPFKHDLFANPCEQSGAACIAVQGKRIALPAMPRLLRMATDGTTGGLELSGPKVPPFFKAAAFSPEGKWVYMTRRFNGSEWGYEWVNGVWRLAYDGLQDAALFLGKDNSKDKVPKKIGNEPDDFICPCSVATDAKGRIYVSDYGKNRVQVFTPEGKFFKTLQVNNPGEVRVHPKTGEIYVARWQVLNRPEVPAVVVKYGPIEDPKVIYEAPIPLPKPNDMTAAFRGGKGSWGVYSRVDVDFWSTPTRIWTVDSYKKIRVYNEEDGKLTLYLDFEKEAGKKIARLRVPHFQRQFVFFDPKREVLYLGETDANEAKYFSTLVGINIHTGKEKVHKLPLVAADAGFDREGHIYLLAGADVARFDPKDWREVPYDYGEEKQNRASLLATPVHSSSSEKHYSMGVSPNGDVIVSGATNTSQIRRGGQGPEGGQRWSPTLYPGRPPGVFAHIYDRHGELIHEDVLPGIGCPTGGLGLDAEGNIYAVVRENRNFNGKPYGEQTGILFKTSPETGRLVTNYHPMVDLKEPPKRPTEAGPMWIDGADWVFGGSSTGATYHCFCRHGRFALDYYARSFVPESFRYSVAVLDTAGNVITRIGRYGNSESAGPKSAVPLGGDEVGLCDAHYVATQSDKRLFISDIGNARIVSVRLDYQTSKSQKLK